MPKKNQKKQRIQADKDVQTKLPPGVKLVRTFEGHQSYVASLAFDPQGDTLASASGDGTVKLWETRSGELLRTLDGHQKSVSTLAFDSKGSMLASGSGV